MKNVSGKDEREIIRPKKKTSRYSQNNDIKNKTKQLPPKHDSKPKGVTEAHNISGTDISVTISPPSTRGTCEPSVVSDVVVTRHEQVYKDSDLTSSSSINTASNNSVKLSTSAAAHTASTASDLQKTTEPSLIGDPRNIAGDILKQLTKTGVKNAAKSVRFDDNINYNEKDTVYVPNVVNARDPSSVENISDSSIEISSKTKSSSVDFLVDYVTTYKPSSTKAVDYTFHQQRDTDKTDHVKVTTNSLDKVENIPKPIQRIASDISTPDNPRQHNPSTIAPPQNSPVTTEESDDKTFSTSSYKDSIDANDKERQRTLDTNKEERPESTFSVSDVTLQDDR